MTTEIKASDLVALAKDLNRHICDLNAQVNTLRAQLLETARESRARERSRKDERRATRGTASDATSPTIWYFGPDPSELSPDGRRNLSELAHGAREKPRR